MKAKVQKVGSTKQFFLVLTPETDAEKADIKAFYESFNGVARSQCIINRPFLYMSPEVEFLIQPMSSGD